MPDTAPHSTTSSPEAGPCRALVVITQTRPQAGQRPQAGFVTQLIACENRIGVYRTARRASSGEAVTRYAGTAGMSLGGFERLV